MELLSALGPEGFFILLVLGLIYAGKNRKTRRYIRKAIERARLELWARSNGIGINLAKKLQRDRWNKLMEQRRFPGLKRGRVSRTPVGISIRLTLGGSLTFKQVSYRVDQLETALGLVSGSARLRTTRRADKIDLHIVLRDPLAGPLLWEPPTGQRRLSDPLWLSLTPFGERVRVDMRNRIGVFGTSGSGKSTVQRNMGAHVIQSVDADLEIWDLKHGLESQHFEGKAHRVTDVAQAIFRTTWLLEHEFPRRAEVMKRKGTSSWKETPDDPALVIMIDEGNVITRGFKADQLKRFFTAVEQGRALGVYFVWVTQMPKATNLPTELRSQLNVRICLRLESAEESRIVFKDEASDGWEPHKLSPYYLLIKSQAHSGPDESKAVFLSEDVFRTVRSSRPVVDDVPDTLPEIGTDVPDNLRPWVVSGTQPVSLSKDMDKTLELSGTDKVVSVLLSSDKPMGVREIARGADMNPGSVQRVLNRETSQGRIRQTAEKKYELVSRLDSTCL